MARSLIKGMAAAAAALLLVLPAAAQDDALVDGLTNPRGISFGPSGVMYIGEAGTGGDVAVQGMFGPALAGGTSHIRAVAPDGTSSIVVAGLPSLNQSGEVTGATVALERDGVLWLTSGLVDPLFPLSRTVIAYDLASQRIAHVIDTFVAETIQNPDGDILDSNPVDLAFDADGSLYIVDAGANTVWRWTVEGMMAGNNALEAFLTWTDNSVPTSLAFDLNGDAYIGFLTGFPFPPGGSRIERWNPAGELVTTYPGLTAVVDVVVHEGDVYAVQFASGFGETGWIADSGSVVRATEAGPEVLRDGLNLPYGLALNADAALIVVVNSAYQMEAGTGMVIPVMGGAMPAADAAPADAAPAEAEPVATPGT